MRIQSINQINQIIGYLGKSQLGFGFGLLILPQTETRWIFRNLVFCKTQLPPKTREETEFGLAQFVLFKNNCLLAYTPRDHPGTRRTSIVVDYSTRKTRTSYRIAEAFIQTVIMYKKFNNATTNTSRVPPAEDCCCQIREVQHSCLTHTSSHVKSIAIPEDREAYIYPCTVAPVLYIPLT